jgi:uncharacterized cofD-like protein
MRRLGEGPRLVALGGGTGLSTLLRAAKRLPLGSLSAIVTVTDDGGSSGRLRREYAMPPPGDVRNCLVALAEDDELLTRLFGYRFPGEGDVGGHSLGNLFMTALHQITGDFASAVRLAAEVLRVHGTVLPATGADVHLVAEGQDGRLLVGETAITKGGPPRRLQLSPADPPALPEAAAAIRAADMVVLGPGSLYTSIVPNLLVPGLRAALMEAHGPRVYVANLVTQPGETDGFDLPRHVETLRTHAPEVEIDILLVNSAPIPSAVAEAYAASGASPVTAPERWKGSGVLVRRPLLTVTAAGTVRHDPDLLAEALGGLLGVHA